MFAMRGIAVSFSIFFILYSALSVAICLVWRRLWLYGQQQPARRCADLLFILRMVPFVVATGVTLVFAVPSFLLLEPRAVEESMGAGAVMLGCCGMAVMLAGAWKAAAALVRVTRTVARWSSEARVIDSCDVGYQQPVAVMRTSAAAPPLTAAGILRPRVWLSGAAEFVLTERELQSALRHEVVHVRRRDNLRKLLLRLVAFPGLARLESAWREATEMAADDAAVSNASEALDLAAAVIKLSRLTPFVPPAELTTALVHSPAESVNARVERLIAWTERRQTPSKRYSLGYTLCAAVALVATLTVTYSEVLVRVHAATEWLVR
ncbi:MAG: M56 family metallopeptidase [Candidatus Sulfotelmatobacter sp.]|jgi:beta-lactamase regulating signal transducer with metallopeptidase domain